MSLENKIMTAMKESMKAKDQTSLRSLRAIKSAIILHKTQKGSSDEISNENELKILQKLVKQRRDSADIYSKNIVEPFGNVYEDISIGKDCFNCSKV